MEGYRNFCNKLWNAARYVMQNCEGHDLATAEANLSLPDRWIISRLSCAIEQFDRAIDGYRFDLASQTAYDFVWNEFCDWYLELSKPMLWDADSDPERAAATRYALVRVLEGTLRLLHPLMPFITEEIWQNVAPLAGCSGETIMLQAWPEAQEYPRDPDAETDITWLQGIIVAVRTIRGEAQLGPGKMLNVLIRNASTEDQQRLLEHAALLKKLARLESIDTVQADTELPPVLSALHGHLEVLVPMAGVVDLDDERDRLARELGKQQKELARLEAKLGNANFLDRAPEEVVAGERLKQQAASDAIVKISSQLDRLKGLH